MPKPLAAAPESTLQSPFKGKRVVLEQTHASIEAMIKIEGGIIESTLSESTDYLILGDTKKSSTLKKDVATLNNKGASIQIIQSGDIVSLCLPQNEDFIALLKEGDALRINSILEVASRTLDDPIEIEGADLRDLELDDCFLQSVKFDRCNFQNALLNSVSFHVVTYSTFSGGNLTNVEFLSIERCTFKNTLMQNPNMKGAFCKFQHVMIENANWLEASCPTLSTFENTTFKRVLMRKTELSSCKFFKCDLRRVDIYNAGISTCTFNECDFQDARVIQSRLYRANLTSCNFENANLALSDLSESQLEGTNFKGCNLSGTRLADVQGNPKDLDSAISNSSDRSKYATGAALKQLANELKSCKSFELVGCIEKDGKEVEISIESTSDWVVTPFNYELIDYNETYVYGAPPRRRQIDGRSIEGAYFHLELVYWGYKLLPETVTAKASKTSLGPEELRTLVLNSWCEVFKVQPPSDEELKKLQAARKDEENAFKKKAVDALRTGAQGIATFNGLSYARKKRISLKKLDLTGCDLTQVQLSSMDVRGSSFKDANLKQADLRRLSAKEASFTNANMDESDCRMIDAESADFTGASLCNANLRGASLSGACFKSANLNGANLIESNIQGVDLTDCDLTNVKFFNTRYNEKTILPKGFNNPRSLKWCGNGVDPFQRQALMQTKSNLSDFGSFLKHVELSVEKDRLKKAISMLKKEKFQLFAEVDETSVTGVVKSQTDPDLVYSCKLTSDGKFCCGTQNLKPCGGLSGALCKHLLVLLLGLTKSGQLDANVSDTWIRASLVNNPKLDKDAISETFLRYKGAEAGEIDWRPTETMPEDYYAF